MSHSVRTVWRRVRVGARNRAVPSLALLTLGAVTALSGCGAEGAPDIAASEHALGTAECLARPAHEVRIQALLVLDDAAGSNCVSSPCTTAQDVADFVALANNTFAPANLSVVYDPDLDFDTIVDPDLNNNLHSNDSGHNWDEANAIAAGYPGKIVVFFRKVAFSNFAYPPDVGQAVPVDAPFPALHPNFIAHDGDQGVARANAQNFSHELGHFLGLYHTQLTWGNYFPGVPPDEGCPNSGGDCSPAELDQAIANLQASRGANALDGDLLADTAQDPGPEYWRMAGLDPATNPSVTINGVTYTPDMQNVMSYWGGFNLSAGQANTVLNSICDPSREELVSAPHARCQDVFVSAGPSCTASITAADVDAGSYDPNGDTITLTLDDTGPFDVAGSPHDVKLLVSDGTYTTPCNAQVFVGDSTTPEVVPPPDVTVAACEAQRIFIGEATASDNCATVTPTGVVVSSNGVALVPPVPVVDGSVLLGPGTHVVRWYATDGVTPTVAEDQLVKVGSVIQADNSFIVEDRARVRLADGSGAGIFNAGTGPTRIGYDAFGGGIVSVGAVTVFDRAIVDGGIAAAGAITVSSSATVGTPIAPFSAVNLPALPPLPAFPPPSLGDRVVNSGGTLNLAPGSYRNVTVNSGGTLRLQAGTYYFDNLTVQSSSTVRVAPTTELYVEVGMALRSPFRALSGNAVQATFLGFAGGSLNVETPFNGTLLAPNATVTFGTGAGLTYTGAFYARVIDVRPQSVLVCSANSAIFPE